MALPFSTTIPSGFLAFVGEAERKPWRVLLWLVVSIGLGLPLADLAGMSFQLTDGPLLEALAKSPPQLAGFGDLGSAAVLTALTAFRMTALAMGFLIAGAVIFRRPAWTFATPARPFDVRAAAAGALTGILFLAGLIAVQTALHTPWKPPVLDAAAAPEIRAAYALAVTALSLLIAAAVEILLHGVILQATGAFLRHRLPLCLSSGALLAALNGSADPIAIASQFALGSALAWSVLTLGGLELAIGYQFASIAGGFLLIAPITRAFGDPPRMDWTDGLSAGLETLAVLSATGLVTLWRRRRAGS